jgi:hypothetical protein
MRKHAGRVEGRKREGMKMAASVTSSRGGRHLVGFYVVRGGRSYMGLLFAPSPSPPLSPYLRKSLTHARPPPRPLREGQAWENERAQMDRRLLPLLPLPLSCSC